MVDRGGLSLSCETLDVFKDPRLTHVATSDFPVEDERYDVVISGQVIEHVRKIWVWMREVSRVCKVGHALFPLDLSGRAFLWVSIRSSANR
jgi:ubiquinone/menaquinone biosynthesis C-methylase UbiE